MGSAPDLRKGLPIKRTPTGPRRHNLMDRLHTKLPGMSKGFGKLAMTPVGGLAIFGTIAGTMSHDNTKNNLASHLAQEGIKLGSDLGFESIVANTVGRLGIAGKLLTGAAIGMSIMGVGPGNVMGALLEDSSAAYKKKHGVGHSPLKQTKETMEMTRRSMSLLGQGTRGHSMLGTEAQYMHN